MEGVMQQVLEHQVAQIAKHLEDQIDSEMHRLDNLNDDDLEAIRKKRAADLKRKQEKTRQWLARGHGEYREIASEKEFFEEMKGEERMICHFFRDNWPCKVMDKHLSTLAKRHLETKFVKIDAEKSPFLTERLKIWMLPTLALIQNEKTVDYVVGFDDVGGKDDFETEALEGRLAKSEMLDYDFGVKAKQQAAAAAGQKSVRSGIYKKTGSDEDSDFDD